MFVLLQCTTVLLFYEIHFLSVHLFTKSVPNIVQSLDSLFYFILSALDRSIIKVKATEREMY